MIEATSMDGAVRFRGTTLLGSKTATGIRVSPGVVVALGPGRRPPVRAS